MNTDFVALAAPRAYKAFVKQLAGPSTYAAILEAVTVARKGKFGARDPEIADAIRNLAHKENDDARG